jgi:uncharacterized protein with FMN-binding domain
MWLFLEILIIAFGLYYLTIIRPQLQEYEQVRNLPLAAIDISAVSGGSYRGSFCYANYTCEVEVEVKNQRVENIQILKNRETKHAKRAEQVVHRALKT